MSFLSRHTDYAVRALLFVAKAKGGVVSTAQLKKELRLPRPFMRKIFQALTKAGYLVSFRGNGGGFQLKIKPNKIYLKDIMILFQGEFDFVKCLFKKKICSDIKVCPLRKEMRGIEGLVLKKVGLITLASLMRG